jgi:hypothetical protein
MHGIPMIFTKKNSHKNHVISTINNVEDVEGTIEIV